MTHTRYESYPIGAYPYPILVRVGFWRIVIHRLQ